MPLLSLPLPRIPTGIVENLPIRVPFPFMRIASILPHAINEPIKSSLLALFKLAWSAKVQIPVLITVVFMACDIRLQLEINIFWETNNARPHALHGSNRNTGGQRRASREDMRRAALVAAALYQQQRRRLIQEMRAQNVRPDPTETGRQPVPLNAPLAAEEDSDLEGSHDGDFYESDTLTCSHRSTNSEAGSYGSNEDETEDAEEKEKQLVTRRKRKVKRSRPSSREPDDDDDEEDEDSTTDEEDNDDDDDDENGGGMNGGPSRYGGPGGYRDDDALDDDDSDDMDDGTQAGGGGGYNSPLVLEIELRHRPLHPQDPNNEQVEDCQIRTTQTLRHNSYCFKNPNIFSVYFRKLYSKSIIEDNENANVSSIEMPRILFL